MRCEHNMKGLNLYVLFRHSSNSAEIDKGDQNIPTRTFGARDFCQPQVELEKFCQGHYSIFLSLWVSISKLSVLYSFKTEVSSLQRGVCREVGGGGGVVGEGGGGYWLPTPLPPHSLGCVTTLKQTPQMKAISQSAAPRGKRQLGDVGGVEEGGIGRRWDMDEGT
jgi:hypothetical protein